MPCRSASVSLPKATSNRSRIAISPAIANGEEQSIRIFPSQSSGMNRNVGSTAGFTTVRFRPYRSAIGSQYAAPEPPSGSTPIRMPAPRIASRSSTAPRSPT